MRANRILRHAGLFLWAGAVSLGGLAVSSAPAAPPGAKAQTPTGTITGSITLAAQTGLKKRDLVDVLVTVPSIQVPPDELRSAAESRGPAICDQRDMAFVPFVLPVLVGQRVQFPNNDTVFHSVTCRSPVKPFDLGIYGPGQVKELAFKKAGTLYLRCAVHSEMQAYIVVIGNPFFAMVRKDGTFRIEGVPPGTHTVRVWHPRAEPVEMEVNVAAGSVAAVSPELKRPAATNGG